MSIKNYAASSQCLEIFKQISRSWSYWFLLQFFFFFSVMEYHQVLIVLNKWTIFHTVW